MKKHGAAAWLSALLSIAGFGAGVGAGLGSCTDDSGPPSMMPMPVPTPTLCADKDGCGPRGPEITNVVDRVVIDMLKKTGRQPAAEDPAVFCRRASIDLNGVSPDPAEVMAQCAGHTPQQIVAYFMNKPSAKHVPSGQVPYLYVNRRAWADTFQYNVSVYNANTTFYGYVADLDNLVKKLYAGQIGYDEFAVETLVAPAFLRQFGLFNNSNLQAAPDLPQIAAAAFRVFLGREALPNEAVDFGNLWRPLTVSYTIPTGYPDCGSYCNIRHYVPVLRGGACTGAEALECRSTVLGPEQVAPSLASGLVAIKDVSAKDAQEIRKAGRLIVKRREFAEAAVDRVLQRYLGWWNAGTYRPDYNIPAVRGALAEFFIQHKYRIRDLETEVLTSVLYTQQQALLPGDIPQAPLFAYGPTKLLPAEAYLDSLSVAAGVKLGGCDFRYSAVTSSNGKDFPGQTPPGAYTYATDNGYDPTYYTATARKFGGCSAGGDRGDTTGLVATVTKREVLDKLCTLPSARASLVPAIINGVGADDGLPQLFAWQVTLGTGSGPSDKQTRQFVDLAKSGGCDGTACNYQQIGSELCMTLFASSLFTYY